MPLCRVIHPNYNESECLLHLQLPMFKTFVVNDTVYWGQWSNNQPVSDYSILVYFVNEALPLVLQNKYVDYIDARQYNNNNTGDLVATIMSKYSAFMKKINSEESVIVWDLDQTLINDDSSPTVADLSKLLLRFKSNFQRCVLWSHGTSAHVNAHLKLYRIEHLFDLIISRKLTNEYDSNKGMGVILRELNKKFGTTKILYSCLVDDKQSNYLEDYTFFLKLEPNKFNHEAEFKEAQVKLSKRIYDLYEHNFKFNENHRLL